MELTEVEQKFARAALAVFKRYGARKTTMEEIAAEAGVSKPTLYATFRNKDAALGATIKLAQGATLQSVTDAWEAAPDLSRKLDIFFERLVIAGFDLFHDSPDASAFETTLGSASDAAIAQTRDATIHLLTQAIQDSPGLERHALDPEVYARFFVTASMNAKRQAKNKDDLLAFLDTLKLSALVVLDQDA